MGTLIVYGFIAIIAISSVIYFKITEKKKTTK